MSWRRVTLYPSDGHSTAKPPSTTRNRRRSFHGALKTAGIPTVGACSVRPSSISTVNVAAVMRQNRMWAVGAGVASNRIVRIAPIPFFRAPQPALDEDAFDFPVVVAIYFYPWSRNHLVAVKIHINRLPAFARMYVRVVDSRTASLPAVHVEKPSFMRKNRPVHTLRIPGGFHCASKSSSSGSCFFAALTYV